MKEKFLPIGTIVTLYGGTKKLMITGYCPLISEEKEISDYSAYTYPEGLISSDKTLVFNHNQIEKIIFLGFEDKEYQEYNKIIFESLNKFNNSGNTH